MTSYEGAANTFNSTGPIHAVKNSGYTYDAASTAVEDRQHENPPQPNPGLERGKPAGERGR
ncbi:MAG: hypothetical protein R3A44_09225 [Caldilineaceae bacterium]